MGQTRNRKLPIAFGAAVLCLTAVWGMAGLLARYASGSSSPSVSRTADFAPTASMEGNTGNIQYGEAPGTAVYHISLANPSEVAVDYSVVVSLSGDTLKDAVFALDGVSGTVGQDGKITFPHTIPLAAHTAGPVVSKLTVTLPEDALEALSAEAEGETMALTGFFTVEAVFTQAD